MIGLSVENQHEITEVTRRAIVDFLMSSGLPWAGRLREDEFLQRLYDLSAISSTDSRMGNAAADIVQHRHSFLDWEEDWVFYDPRFNLLNAPDFQFLRFLCETIHPVVRPNVGHVTALLTVYNEKLLPDGWSLVESQRISGKPIFAAEKADQRLEVFDEPTGWDKADRQIEEARSSLRSAMSEEQFQTVGLVCREAIISTAQEVFDPTLHKASDGIVPSETDANRMLEGFFNFELPGSSNRATRAYAKAALNLALALQHKRTADFRTAALCLEATVSTVNIVAVIAGRR